MDYYFDTEFIEGKQKLMFGVGKPTIDLISIGIVSSDGREYYAVSNEFNLKETWNRFQVKKSVLFSYPEGGSSFSEYVEVREYWIRENVLKGIFLELSYAESVGGVPLTTVEYGNFEHRYVGEFTYKNMKRLLKKYGKSRELIAREIKQFTGSSNLLINKGEDFIDKSIEFYGYYSAYDWVVFCWLFGRMIDLPKGFPKYCKDLKHMLDDKVEVFCESEIKSTSFKSALKRLKEKHADYPKQGNEHNALDGAKRNVKLHEFIKDL